MDFNHQFFSERYKFSSKFIFSEHYSSSLREISFCIFQKIVNQIRQFNWYITNKGSILSENSYSVFVIAQSYFLSSLELLVIFLAVEFLIIFRKPADFINMLPPYNTLKLTITVCYILMVLLLSIMNELSNICHWFSSNQLA